MKLFVLGVPHTVTSPDFSHCAFSMKVLHLCKMMKREGHEVIHLGVEGSEVECTENVSLVSHSEWKHFYGHPGKNYFKTKDDGECELYTRKWIKRAKLAILERCDNNLESIVCVTWNGRAQIEAAQASGQFVVESGIGYGNADVPAGFADFRVYESYAWLHMALGRERLHTAPPKWYWVVIPNAFDVSMFEFRERRGEDFLYLGRLNDDKGVWMVIDASKRANRKLTICGQGDPSRFLKDNPHVTYHEPVGVDGRRRLLADCRAVFCLSEYVEPFCGVSIEAMLSGAPVISSDHGAFTENILHGITGYRCRNMNDVTWAAKNIDKINPMKCRDWAVSNFSLERIAPMYTHYFQSVLNTRTKERDWLWHDPCRTNLDWLKRSYPNGG